METTTTKRRRLFNANITGLTEIDFFRENIMADITEASEEDRNKEHYSFQIDGKDFGIYFNTFDESLLAYIAHKNGISKNDIQICVKHAYKILQN